MAFAQKVGATAIFHVRLLDGTPEQSAEMVRYTNIEKKSNVHIGPSETNQLYLMMN